MPSSKFFSFTRVLCFSIGVQINWITSVISSSTREKRGKNPKKSVQSKRKRETPYSSTSVTFFSAHSLLCVFSQIPHTFNQCTSLATKQVKRWRKLSCQSILKFKLTRTIE
jgi:hypothetical protein